MSRNSHYYGISGISLMSCEYPSFLAIIWKQTKFRHATISKARNEIHANTIQDLRYLISEWNRAKFNNHKWSVDFYLFLAMYHHWKIL